MADLITRQLFLRTNRLTDIVIEVERTIAKEHPGKKLEIVSFEMAAGSPTKQYGQSVTVKYRERHVLIESAEIPAVSTAYTLG